MASPPEGAPPTPPTPPVTPAPPRRRWARVWFLLGPLLVVMFLGGIIGGFSIVPYTVLSPGSATAGEGLVQIKGHPAYAHSGKLLFVTVTVASHVTAAEAIYGWLAGDQAVKPSPEVIGTHNAEEDQRSGLIEMLTSKEAAVVVALRRLGYTVPETDTGALVADVSPGTPVYGKVGIGDTITAINDQPVATLNDLRRILATFKPGDRVTLTVRGIAQSAAIDAKSGKVTTVPVTLRSFPAQNGLPADPNRPYLGISATNDARFTLPFPVDINTGAVGGPSAGLAFTLTLMDRLTPDGILNGHKVAVTGTISLDGSVGAVGGVPQKTIAVRRAGAELFIVPSSEYHQAKANAGHMRVEKADTLDQALQIIATFGRGGS